MNRRNFINGLLAAGASFMVLPGAGRVYKAVVVQAPFDPVAYMGEWRWHPRWNAMLTEHVWPGRTGETVRLVS